MEIHQHPDCPSVFQPTLDSGDCPGYPFQSTLKTGFHTVPVCLRSKTALGFHAVPAYPVMPMPWISSQFTLKTGRCPSLSRDANAMKIQWVCIVPVHFTLSHAVPVCLEGCLSSIYNTWISKSTCKMFNSIYNTWVSNSKCNMFNVCKLK